MKRIAIIAATAALAFASSAFASPASDAWVAKTRAALQAKIAEAGLADDGKTVQLRVRVDSQGAGSVTIAGTSGSSDFDTAAKAAAKSADVSRPPAELVGRTVVFTVGAN